MAIKKRRGKERKGATLVEFAFVLPIILALFFALWEWSRVELIRQVSATACYQAARRGTLPNATAVDVREVADLVLDTYFVKNSTVIASTAGGETTVNVSVPLDDNLWTVGKFFAGRDVTSDFTLRNEFN